MGFFSKRDYRIEQLEQKHEGYFGFLKGNISRLFEWIKYLSHRDELQEQRLQQLEQLRSEEMKRVNYVMTKMHEMETPVLAEEDKRKIENMHGNYELLVSKINHLEQELISMKNARTQIVRENPIKEKQTVYEKIASKIQKKSKKYVKTAIQNLIKKYDEITGTQLKEIVVDEQQLCSRSSFYRLLDELEKDKEIRSERFGRDKKYMQIEVLKKH